MALTPMAIGSAGPHAVRRRYACITASSSVSFTSRRTTINSARAQSLSVSCLMTLIICVMLHTQPFSGPLSGTTRMSRYQKGKTNLDFTEARDSERQWHQQGHICKSAPRSGQITTPAPHHSVFYRPDALLAAQPTASKHSRHICVMLSVVKL